MSLLKIILIPFSVIYCGIIFLRNKLYDLKIFKSHKVFKPVISIGNITTGGTGKTPLTIFTAKYILDKNKTVGIISRGYKRDSERTVIVSDGNSINENVEDSGDELILIANELMKNYKGRFFIAACADRISASKLLIEKFNPDIIICDDGFQHRKIYRNLDVVLIDSHDYLNKRFANSFTLPSGNLRESFTNLNRADLIIQNNKSYDYESIILPFSSAKEIIPMRYKTEYFIDYKNGILPEKDLRSEAIVFSGIANDESFVKMITDNGIKINQKIKFSDHHNYIKSDIEALKNKFDNGKIFITTEKDFVRLKKFKDFTENYPVYYLKINIELAENQEEFFKKIDELI